MTIQIIKSEVRDMVKVLDTCRESTAASAVYFFPEAFNRPFDPKLHGEYFAALDDPDIYKLLTMVSRGFGKTTLNHLAYAARLIIFLQTNYLVLVAANQELAEEQSVNLRDELANNKRVRSAVKFLYGKSTLKSKKWAAGEWVTVMNQKVAAFGADKRIRGTKHGNFRPTHILIDDLETKEDVRNERVMRFRRQWLNNAVSKAFDLSEYSRIRGHRWKLLVSGTILGENAVLAHASRWADRDANSSNPYRWHKVHLDICDDECRSYYPNFLTTEFLRAERDEARENGEIDQWYMERRNMIVPGEDARFPPSIFRGIHYNELKERLWRNPNVENIALYDPARTAEDYSSEHCVMILGVDREQNMIYVRHIENGTWNVDEAQDKVLEAAQYYRCQAIGIDVNGPNDWIIHSFEMEMVRQGYNFEIVKLPNSGSKEQRVASLRSFYGRRQVKHNEQCCGTLEHQLGMFPRPEKWDVADCMAYIVPMMKEGGRFWRQEISRPVSKYQEDDDEMQAQEYNRREDLVSAIAEIA